MQQTQRMFIHFSFSCVALCHNRVISEGTSHVEQTRRSSSLLFLLRTGTEATGVVGKLPFKKQKP